MENKNIAVIILAAGKSTRMKSETPKVLHPICGRPMLEFVLDLVSSLKPKETVAVLGYKHELVKEHLRPRIKIAIQKNMLGTADAVKSALPSLKGFKGTVLVLYGDNPLLKKETVRKLLKYHSENNLDATLLTANLENPASYGRILRDKYSSVSGIVEEKDADEVQKDIKEINTGIICFNKESLESSLRLVRPNNRKKEYYLTDTIDILYKKGKLVDGINISDINEAFGINSRVDLAKADSIMRQRVNEEYMLKGVSIVDPSSAFISYGTKIGKDTVIYPFTVIERNVKIGKRCSLGPFIRVRRGSELKDDVTVGNFLEVNRSKISSKSKAKHFGYLGDARIGKHVNIGAGTVTANYDSGKKSVTTIKDGAFIGCDTIIVAPVTIGKNAKTGAGSVVVKNSKVAQGAVVVGVPAKTLKKPKR